MYGELIEPPPPHRSVKMRENDYSMHQLQITGTLDFRSEIKSFYIAEMNEIHMTSQMRTRDIRHRVAQSPQPPHWPLANHISHEHFEMNS